MQSIKEYVNNALNEEWEAWDSEIPDQLNECLKFIKSSQFRPWIISEVEDEDIVEEVYEDLVAAFEHLIMMCQDFIDTTEATSATKFWKEVQDNFDIDWWDSSDVEDEQATSMAGAMFPAMFKKATGKKIKVDFSF